MVCTAGHVHVFHNQRYRLGGHTFVAIKNAKQEVESSLWHTRAWTYQEGLLSRRRVVFTETQTYLQCLTSLQINGPTDTDYSSDNCLANVRVFPNRRIGHGKLAFSDRTEEYYGRELSYHTDIINAFTGIIQAFQHRDIRPKYMASHCSPRIGNDKYSQSKR